MTEKEEKYEDCLYRKIEFLHEKSKQNHNSLILFSEIITKFINTISDFSKSLSTIKNKNPKIIEDSESSMGKLVHFFQVSINDHIEEFKECAQHLNFTIIGPLIKTIEEKYIKEKELYNNYNKVKNIFNNSKLILEKSKKEFDYNAKLCESNILNLVQTKSFDINSANDISKIEERTKLSIATTKTFEDKYMQCLEEANKARENEINKQKELLKFYQIIENDFNSKISCMITFTVPLIKKMYSSLLKSIEVVEDKCKTVKIKKDINDFIEKNKSDIKPYEEIKFIPYYPEASLDISSITGNDKKDLENLDINYNVILKLHENFRDIRKDINMEEEKKKFRLRTLCSKIFKIGPNVNFKKEEKEELISFLKENTYKSYFLITLSKQRTKGRFQRSETLLNDLSEIINVILNEAEKEKDYEGAKNCLILSQTFYFEIQKGKTKKKKYLFDYIRKNKWLNSIEFWEGIIDYMIKTEIKKNLDINKKNNYTESEKEIKTRQSNIAFSQVLSYSNNMIEFCINKEDIIKTVDIFVKKYDIEKPMAEAIYENIKSTPLPEIDDKEEENEDDINNINKRPKAQSVVKKSEEVSNVDKRSKSLKIKESSNKKIPQDNNEEKNNIIENNKNTEITESNKNEEKNDNEKKEKEIEEKTGKEDKKEVEEKGENNISKENESEKTEGEKVIEQKKLGENEKVEENELEKNK